MTNLHRFTSFIFTITSMLTIVGGDVLEQKNQTLNGIVLASNHFGFNLLRELSKENGPAPTVAAATAATAAANATSNNQNVTSNDSVVGAVGKDNIFFSPYSLLMAFTMVYVGANGQTARQIESTFGFELAEMNRTEIVQNISQTIAETVTTGTNQTYTLKIANAMITRKNSPINPNYAKSLRETFQAELFEANSGITQLINTWVANKTNGKIDPLLRDSSLDTGNIVLALLNAIYFKGTWTLRFNPNDTKLDKFYGPNGVQYDAVPYMHKKDFYRVGNLAELNATILELRYSTAMVGENDTVDILTDFVTENPVPLDGLAMYAILPNERTDNLETIKHSLNPWYIEACIKRLYSQKIELKFPKMKFDTNYHMVHTLQSLGLVDIFDGGLANLTGITNTGTPFAISDVQHTATVEVNEEGSEAAAVTLIAITRSGKPRFLPPKYEFDHPFIFFIRHRKTGQIYFIGEINRL